MRRYWPDDAKRRLVELSYRPDFSIAETALRYGVNANQLHTWRRQFGKDEPTVVAAKPTLEFAAVDIVAAPSGPRPRGGGAGVIEIELTCGAKVRVGDDVGENSLRRVLSALGAR
jgi:transposase